MQKVTKFYSGENAEEIKRGNEFFSRLKILSDQDMAFPRVALGKLSYNLLELLKVALKSQHGDARFKENIELLIKTLEEFGKTDMRGVEVFNKHLENVVKKIGFTDFQKLMADRYR